MIKKVFNKLSIQISAIIVLFGFLGIVVFMFFYNNKDTFFTIARDFKSIDVNLETYTNNLKNEFKKHDVSINDFDAMKKIIGSNDYYSVLIYNSDDNSIIFSSFATILENSLIDFTIYDTNVIFDDNDYHFSVELIDDEIEVYVYSYEIAKFVMPYIICSFLIALSVFLIPIFYFIHRKVKYIIQLKDEVMIMSTGNLNHILSVNTKDEIGDLSNQINYLRQSLKDTIAANEANQKASYELVTALAHDLRTPLTSLLGYLDIIRLKRYRDDQQYQKYLNASISKVNQINEITNKMFEYFLVFSKDYETELSAVSTSVVVDYINENIEFLKANGFNLIETIDNTDYLLWGNINLIRRVIDNLFSNLFKYANCNEPIYVTISYDDNFNILIKNSIKNVNEHIESNQIGLKSVCQMINIHHGNIEINHDETMFYINISIPLKK